MKVWRVVAVAVQIYDFHIFALIYSSLRGFIAKQQNEPLSVGFLAQLIKHCTCIAEVMGSTHKPESFFRPNFYYCLTSVHNSDDHSHLHSLMCSSNIFFSYSHSHLQKEDTFSATLCWVSKVIQACFGLALLGSVIGWKNSRHFLTYAKQNRNQSWLGRSWS